MKQLAALRATLSVAGVVFAASVLLLATQARRCARAIRTGEKLAVHATGLARRIDKPAARVLIVGDSTGLGVGADRAEDSIAGLLAREHPQVDIINGSVRGATLANVVGLLQAPPLHRFDVVLLFAGANDILQHRRLHDLFRDSESLLRKLHRYGDAIVWMGPANIGLAPLFVPPVSWWFSRKARHARDVFMRVARRERVHYVDFFRQARFDPFSAAPQLFFAADEIHPSTHAYRYCYHAAAIGQRVAACLHALPRQTAAAGKGAARGMP